MSSIRVYDALTDSAGWPTQVFRKYRRIMTASIGYFNYRSAVAAFVMRVLQYRGMFHKELSEIEAMLDGYFFAFSDLAGGIDNRESFNFKFSDWLWERKELAPAHGWANSVHSFAKENNLDAEQIFQSFVKDYLAVWNAQLDVRGEEV
jgi:hypothetical protein